MKRRAFLGFLGGAAVAGPAVAPRLAQGLAASGGVPMPPMGGGYYGSATSAGMGIDHSYALSRITKLKAMLSGEDPEIKRERHRSRQYQIEMVERFRLDGLRSVSAQHRSQMFIDGNLDRQERMNRMHYQNELDDLLKINLPF